MASPRPDQERKEASQSGGGSNRGGASERRERAALNAQRAALDAIKAVDAQATPATQADFDRGNQTFNNSDEIIASNNREAEAKDAETLRRVAASKKATEFLMSPDQRKATEKAGRKGFPAGSLAKNALSLNVFGAISDLGGYIGKTKQQTLDKIMADYGVDEARADEIATKNGLLGRKGEFAPGRDDRFTGPINETQQQEFERTDRRDGNAQNRREGQSSFDDYLDAELPGTNAPTPAGGGDNTMSFTFGGKEVNFTPKAVWGPQIMREEIASREKLGRMGIEAGEPGWMDYVLSGVSAGESSGAFDNIDKWFE